MKEALCFDHFVDFYFCFAKNRKHFAEVKSFFCASVMFL